MGKPTRTVALIVLIETDDERLWPERVDVSTVSKMATVEQALGAMAPILNRFRGE